jgi:hypothetical protein
MQKGGIVEVIRGTYTGGRKGHVLNVRTRRHIKVQIKLFNGLVVWVKRGYLVRCWEDELDELVRLGRRIHTRSVQAEVDRRYAILLPPPPPPLP